MSNIFVTGLGFLIVSAFPLESPEYRHYFEVGGTILCVLALAGRADEHAQQIKKSKEK